MKKFVVVTIVSSLLLGCTKENELQHLYNKFSGRWEYEQYIGYPFVNTFLPAGNGRIIQLFSDGTFERRAFDTVLFRGRYSVHEKSDCSPGGGNVFFSTNDTTFLWDSYIDISNAKLLLTTSNCNLDGGTTFYRKAE